MATYYVNTSNSGEADGHSAETGWTSLASAKSMLEGPAYFNGTTLPSDTTIECSGAVDDTSVVDFSGWTSAGYMFTIQAAAGHTALASGWRSNAYRLNGTSTYLIKLPAKATLNGLQARFLNTTNNSATGLQAYYSGAGKDIRVINCRLHGVFGVRTGSGVFGISVGSSGGAVVLNNVAIVIESAGATGCRGVSENASSIATYLYNVTVRDLSGNATGVNTGTSNVRARNVLVDGAAVGFGGTGTFHTDSNYNRCSDANLPPGENSYDSREFTFVAGADSVQLDPTDVGARDHGEDLGDLTHWYVGSDTDIEGNARPRGSAWDVGAHEAVAPASSFVPRIIFFLQGLIATGAVLPSHLLRQAEREHGYVKRESGLYLPAWI